MLELKPEVFCQYIIKLNTFPKTWHFYSQLRFTKNKRKCVYKKNSIKRFITALLNNPKLEAPGVSISSTMNKQTVLNSYKEIVLYKYKSELLICQTTGMGLRHTKLNERSITQKSTYCAIPFIQNSRTGKIKLGFQVCIQGSQKLPLHSNSN